MAKMVVKLKDLADLSPVIQTLLEEQNAPTRLLCKGLHPVTSHDLRPLMYESKEHDSLSWSAASGIESYLWAIKDKGDREPWKFVIAAPTSSELATKLALALMISQLELDYPDGDEQIFQENRAFWYDLRMNRRKQSLPLESATPVWLRCIVINGIYAGMDKLRIGQLRDILTEYDSSNIVMIVHGPDPLRTCIDELSIFPDGAIALRLGI